MATLRSPQAEFPSRTHHNKGFNNVYGEYAFTANPTAADVIQICKVPPNAKVVQVTISADRIDTNGTPTMTFQVGDGTTANKFIGTTTAAALAGTTGGPPVSLNNAAGFGFTPSTTVETYITVTVVAAAATFAAGSIKVFVQFELQN